MTLLIFGEANVLYAHALAILSASLFLEALLRAARGTGRVPAAGGGHLDRFAAWPLGAPVTSAGSAQVLTRPEPRARTFAPESEMRGYEEGAHHVRVAHPEVVAPVPPAARVLQKKEVKYFIYLFCLTPHSKH